MFVLRRNDERRHLKHVKSKIWQTFYPKDQSAFLAGGFADLLGFNEVRIPPGGVLPGLNPTADVFTYVHKGVIAQRHEGAKVVVSGGDFQRMATRGRHEGTNISPTDWAHIFRLRIACRSSPEGQLDGTNQQRRFTAAQRHNTLCTVASLDGASGSLALHSDSFIYSSILDLGHHLVHALQPTRCAWLHIVHGKAILGEVTLSQGDGIGISESHAVSLTAQEDSEILLIDLGMASTLSAIGDSA